MGGNEHVYNKESLMLMQILGGRPPSERRELFDMDEVSRMSALGLSVQVNDANSPVGDDVLNDSNSSRGDDSSSGDDFISRAQSLRVASHIAIWSLFFAAIGSA